MITPDRKLDPSLIEEHHSFLRRLAKSLVHDEQLSHDVVQQTWLVALSAGDAPAERGWL
jgi:DNA-directed RNA polymerase specialized sigma24 family protein